MERKRPSREDKGAPKWMVTFTDLMTLLMVFFILLFSMSVVDASKFRAVAESFQQRGIFNFYPSLIPLENPAEDISVDKDPFDDKKDSQKNTGDEDVSDYDLLQLYEEVQQFLEGNNLTEVISASRDDRGVVLVLQERTLFDTGEAFILEEAKPFLQKVGTLLEAIPNLVRVEGHTDSRPISTFRYPSNWELSGARSSSVIRYLRQHNNLEEYRFISVGYADTRPVAPNTTAENMQKNRRVVIVISDPNYNEDDLY